MKKHKSQMIFLFFLINLTLGESSKAWGTLAQLVFISLPDHLLVMMLSHHSLILPHGDSTHPPTVFMGFFLMNILVVVVRKAIFLDI